MKQKKGGRNGTALQNGFWLTERLPFGHGDELAPKEAPGG